MWDDKALAQLHPALSGEHVTALAGTEAPLGVSEFQDGRFTRLLAAGYFASSLLACGETLSIGTLEEGVVDVALTAQRPRLRGAEAAGDLGAVEKLLDMEDRLYALTDHGLYERAPARLGTAHEIRCDAYAKTGTAPCRHARRTSGDGYAVALYPAGDPRFALLTSLDGAPGSHAAKMCGEMLRRAG